MACSVAFVCCSCRALRFTPGIAPSAPPAAPPRRSRSSSPALFRDVGNGTPPPCFDSHYDDYDDEAYAKALAEADTCDNSSCPHGTDEPATYSITVEQFDEGSEEIYDRIFRACSTCNRSCKKSFMGHRIKSRTFDNSAREALANKTASGPAQAKLCDANQASDRHLPLDDGLPTATPLQNAVAGSSPLSIITSLQDALRLSTTGHLHQPLLSLVSASVTMQVAPTM